MNVLHTLRSRGTRTIPTIESDTSKLVSARWILAVQVFLGALLLLWCGTALFPAVTWFLAIAYALVALSVIRTYTPLVMIFTVVFAVIKALTYNDASISVVTLVLAALVIISVRSHSLLQFAQGKAKLEGLLIIHHLRSAASLAAGMWLAGALAMLLGGLGDGAVSLVIVIVSAVVLIGSVFYEQISLWLSTVADVPGKSSGKTSRKKK